MPRFIITISTTKDNNGVDITECTPHAVVLSRGDEIAWGSVIGDHEVKIQPDARPQPLLNQPWRGTIGQTSTPPVGTVAPTAQPGHYIALATLTLPDNRQIGPGGAIIIIK
jgi:hypothetical protein